MRKQVYIKTIGCQMNVYDSEQMAGRLRGIGYQAAPSMKRADLVIVNTCAIREKAEQKVFSFLGRLAELKRRNPGLIIAVGGCVAQQEGRRILDRVPHVDAVFGTHAVGRLPDIIQRIERRRKSVVDVEMADGILDVVPEAVDGASEEVSKFVTIMQGCENYCSYCVVPYVRGKEISRRPESILSEIRGLVRAGVREVTLLGQNVNSYGGNGSGVRFPDLLAMVNDLDGLWRIRFATSHPKDLSESLMTCFRDLDKLCRHIHLPVQSGANRILKRMNRKYRREDYLEKADRLRRLCPEIAVSTDIIVGFPGETRADFEQTLDLIKIMEYDSLFAFIYSDRPNAPAARFSDKVTEAEKKERLQAVLETQEGITLRKHRALVGAVQEVLAEGVSRKEMKKASASPDVQWSGRTATNKIVNFVQKAGVDSEPCAFTGRIVRVRIEKAFPHSLWGRAAEGGSVSDHPKREKTYAA